MNPVGGEPWRRISVDTGDIADRVVEVRDQGLEVGPVHRRVQIAAVDVEDSDMQLGPRWTWLRSMLIGMFRSTRSGLENDTERAGIASSVEDCVRRATSLASAPESRDRTRQAALASDLFDSREDAEAIAAVLEQAASR